MMLIDMIEEQKYTFLKWNGEMQQISSSSYYKSMNFTDSINVIKQQVVSSLNH